MEDRRDTIDEPRSTLDKPMVSDPERPTEAGSKQDVHGIAEEAKEQARHTAARARQEVEDQIREQRTAVVEELESIERALHRAADSLEEEGRSATSRSMRSLADTLGRLSQEVRGKSLGGLFGAVDDIGRREPALMFAGAAAAGFAMSRFIKSSGGAQEEEVPPMDSPAGEGGVTW